MEAVLTSLASSSSLLLLLPLLILLIILNLICYPFSNRRPLPPGPKPWPFIGNLVHLGKKPHVSLAQLAKIHGPLISLKLGTQLLVVGTSPTVATEILKTHDRLLSGRYLPKASPYESHVLDRVAVVWATKCTKEWKSLRDLFRNELFSSKAIQSQANIREKKVAEMVDLLTSQQGKIVNIGKIVFGTVFNILSNISMSKDFITSEEIKQGVGATGLKNLMWRVLELAVAPNLSDFFPILAPFDLQGIKRKNTRYVNEIFSTWEIHIRERRESRRLGDVSRTDFLDVFLENEFDNNQINWLFLEFFIAGTDTTTGTIEWAMAELLKNKDKMEKLKEELAREFKEPNWIVKESKVSLSQLHYLNACVRETLRLHPAAPLLVPHRALQDCEVHNYSIPKDTRVLVNIWAIGRDPAVWEDPLSFKPERFLDCDIVDFRGQNFEFTPFGAGRRMCPGLSMAIKHVSLILANLVHCFEWSLPDHVIPTELDMNEKFGLTLQKEQPLFCVPTQETVETSMEYIFG